MIKAITKEFGSWNEVYIYEKETGCLYHDNCIGDNVCIIVVCCRDCTLWCLLWELLYRKYEFNIYGLFSMAYSGYYSLYTWKPLGH